MSANLEAIRVARTWLNSRRPYLSTAVYSLVLVESDSVDLMAVDRWWRCYWNPANLRKLTVEQQGSLLYHEVWHLLREHAQRAEALGIACDGKVVDALLCKLWNYCTDAEINDDAEKEPEIELPPGGVYPRDLDCEDGLTAEEYMDRVKRKTPPPFPQDGEGNGTSPSCGGTTGAPSPKEGRSGSAKKEKHGQEAGEFGHGGGSGSDGVTRPWEKAQNDPVHPGMSAGEARLIAHEVAQQILAQGHGRGSIPTGAVRWAQEVLSPPKVRWTDEVLSVLRGRCAHVAGCWDYTYSRPSRRQGMSRDIVIPAMYRPRPQVAAVIDTSGSMSDKQTGIAILELSRLIRQLGVPAHVLSCDAAAHHAVQCFGKVDRKLYGGGGTDMGIGIKEAMKLKPAPNVVVVFTDGLTGWPDEGPGVAVVIILISGDAIATPSWARTIRVNPADFSVREETQPAKAGFQG